MYCNFLFTASSFGLWKEDVINRACVLSLLSCSFMFMQTFLQILVYAFVLTKNFYIGPTL